MKKINKKSLIITLTLLISVALYIWYSTKSLSRDSLGTTGVVPYDDVNNRMGINEQIILSQQGVIKDDSFMLTPLGGSRFEVEMYGDSEGAKEDFQQWLTSNNYSHIDSTVFMYIESSNN